MRLLLVDDTPENLHLFGKLLGADGWEVRPAGSGEEALSALEQGPFQLVLLDLMMPGLDGFETLAAMKARCADLPPVLALTGLASPEDLERCQAAGFAGHVPKPVTRAQLREALAPFRAVAPTLDGGDRVQSTITRLRPRYLERRRADLAQMRRALDEGDLGRLGAMGHRLAGSAGSYGFARLSELCRALESAVAEDDPDRARAAVDDVERCLTELWSLAPRPDRG